MGKSWFHRLALIAAIMALVVVVLGAWVRLSHAGLGCPDWPRCYGQLLVPETPAAVAAANEAFPDRPLEVGKAWREMIHRYLAGLLGFAILALAVIAWRHRHQPGQPVALPLLLLGLVIFQATLGMWTVTLKLKPLVVVAHLLGGMSVLALLWWLALPALLRRSRHVASEPAVARVVLAGIVLLGLQIALGGWTSSNYAAMACPDFPTCQTRWWPEMDFRQAFVLWRGLGIDYEGGVLDHPARVAIHVTHRIGALFTAVFVGALSIMVVLRARQRALRLAGLVLAAMLVLQLGLGVSIIKLGLPVPLATAHNGTAAALLLALVSLYYLSGRIPRGLEHGG